MLEWFEDLGTKIVSDFLQSWPSLESVKQVRSEELEKFFRQHNSTRKDVIEGRINSIKQSIPLTTDKAVINSSVMMARALASEMKSVIEAIAEFDREIEDLCSSHRNYELFESLPGAGPVYSSRLMAAFGSNRGKYSTADEMACLSGIAPVVERSGRSKWVRWRYLRSDISAPDLSGVCGRINQAFILGEGILPIAEGEGEDTQQSGEGAGLQVDKDNMEMLEDQQAL